MRSMGVQFFRRLMRERLMAILSGFLDGLALLLAGLGLYGVTAYAVGRRRAEFGVRLALGAAPGGIVRLALRRVAALVGLGPAEWPASPFRRCRPHARGCLRRRLAWAHFTLNSSVHLRIL
jgi:hypothetical protein